MYSRNGIAQELFIGIDQSIICIHIRGHYIHFVLSLSVWLVVLILYIAVQIRDFTFIYMHIITEIFLLFFLRLLLFFCCCRYYYIILILFSCVCVHCNNHFYSSYMSILWCANLSETNSLSLETRIYALILTF